MYSMKTIICQMCGNTFETAANHASYCANCRIERQKLRSRVYTSKVKNNEPKRTIGSTDICPQCGKAYVINSASQKVCEDCRKSYTNQRKQKTNNAYSEKTYDKLVAYVKKGERDKLKKICEKQGISMSELINYGISLAVAEIEKYEQDKSLETQSL